MNLLLFLVLICVIVQLHNCPYVPSVLKKQKQTLCWLAIGILVLCIISMNIEGIMIKRKFFGRQKEKEISLLCSDDSDCNKLPKKGKKGKGYPVEEGGRGLQNSLYFKKYFSPGMMSHNRVMHDFSKWEIDGNKNSCYKGCNEWGKDEYGEGTEITELKIPESGLCVEKKIDNDKNEAELIKKCTKAKDIYEDITPKKKEEMEDAQKYLQKSLPRKDCKNLFTISDTDKDGDIDKPEFLNMCKGRLGGLVEKLNIFTNSLRG